MRTVLTALAACVALAGCAAPAPTDPNADTCARLSAALEANDPAQLGGRQAITAEAGEPTDPELRRAARAMGAKVQKRLSWSIEALQLADRCAALGYPLSADAVDKL